MTSRLFVSRWLVTQTEPLIPTTTRLAIDREMQAAFEADPKWAAAWAGGVVSSLIRSLPDDDPWRHLTAFFEPLEPLIGYAGVGRPSKGATTAQGDFGSLRDMLDIRAPELSDAQSDVGLAAVADPISDQAAATIAYAEVSWARAAFVLETVDPEELFGVATDAIRYAAARRRAYVGTDDPFFVHLCFAWQWRADRSVEAEYWDTDEIDVELRENSIDPGSYAAMCLDPQLHPEFKRPEGPIEF